MTCSSIPDLSNATPLAFNTEKPSAVDLTIDETSHCLLVDGGQKSLYHVVGLPTESSSYNQREESVPTGNSIFAPELLILDEKGNLLRQIPHKDFIYRGDELTVLLRTHGKERYLVAASDPLVVGSEESRIMDSISAVPVMVATPGFVMAANRYSGAEGTQTLTYSHTGRLHVVASAIPTAK